MNKNHRKAEIKIQVELNENNVPELMSWSATDQNNKNNLAKAIILSLWNAEKKSSFNIDLWTKDMPMEEMKFFVFQNLLKMSAILERSTGDKKLINSMKEFSKQFGQMANLLKNQ